jgi:hypothetical protein
MGEYACASREVSRAGLDFAIGASATCAGGCCVAVKVGYLTKVSCLNISMSMGVDFILSPTVM